jgi:hypothetical protein
LLFLLFLRLLFRLLGFLGTQCARKNER